MWSIQSFFSYSSLKFNLHNRKVSFLCPKFFVTHSALRTRSVYLTLIQSHPMPSQTGPLTMHRVLSPDGLTLFLPIFFAKFTPVLGHAQRFLNGSPVLLVIATLAWVSSCRMFKALLSYVLHENRDFIFCVIFFRFSIF